jgi:hypothetical protein
MQYFISARRYFDKRYGNSYYSLRIMGNGRDVIVPFTYGHGEGTYVARAMSALGIGIDNIYLMSHDERRSLFVVDETTVTRRKDLHNGGK